MATIIDRKGQWEYTERKLVEALVFGLHIDGAHHKQHALEEALEALIGPERFKALKDEEQWEDGIPS